MKKALPILALGILVCIALYLAWQFSEPAAPEPLAKKETAKSISDKKASSTKSTQAISLAPLATQSPQSPDAAQALLDDFYLTGNKDALNKAQELYSTDPNVILVSSLEARTPASPFLAALEKLQPNNALANMIRAGLYAEQGDLKRFAEELEKALAKDHLSLNGQERLNRLLDQILSQPMTAELSDVFNQFDHNFGKLMYLTHQLLLKNPSLYGDELTTISKGLQLVENWRLSNDMEHFPIAADHMERDLLRLAQLTDDYGTEGQKVADRLAVVQAELTKKWDGVTRSSSLVWAKPTDLTRVRDYLTHIRTQGVSTTLDWVMTLPAPTLNPGN